MSGVSIFFNFVFIVIIGVLSYLYYKKRKASGCPILPVPQTSCANLGISVDRNSKFGNIYTQLQQVISSTQKGVCTSYNTDTIIQKIYTAIDSKPDIRTCKEFKDTVNAALLDAKTKGLAMDSENAQAIDLLQNLVLLVATEGCKDGDDSKAAAAQIKSIIKDVLNSLCPMSEIEKFSPVLVSLPM